MGNQKGSKGEREVSKLLLAWWEQYEPTVGDKKLRFVRTPLSGGWLHADGFNACGDIMTNSLHFPFSVEVKRRETWSMKRFLDGKPSPVWSWWLQCQADARSARREPMLWFRQNRKPWMVLLRKDYASGLQGIDPPGAVWSDRLRMHVDCEEVPVLYLARTILGHSPSVFAL